MSASRDSAVFTRRTLLGGVGVGAIAAAIGVPGTASADPGTDDGMEQLDESNASLLRFATFNIHHGASIDDVFDLERTASIIESLDVDIIGLQEVDRFWQRSDYIDEPAWFAERLGMEAIFGANYLPGPEFPGDRDREYGTAILSKWPIQAWDNVYLPRFGEHEQRGLLRATITANGSRVNFYNTHLQHDNDPEREAQAQAIVDLLGAEPERAVMTGDFNCESGSVAHQIVSGAFYDAWELVGDGPGYTYHTPDPDRRIDYVWSGRGPGILPLMEETAPLDPPASDHLPVVGQFLVLKGRN